jgi:Mg2+/Co2+ transporter CorC
MTKYLFDALENLADNVSFLVNHDENSVIDYETKIMLEAALKVAAESTGKYERENKGSNLLDFAIEAATSV